MRLTVHPVPGHGTEDVLVVGQGPHAGSVLTGVEGGALLRLSPDGRRVTRVADTGGRPLGLEWLPDGRVLVCDSTRGLLAVEVEAPGGEGRVEQLVAHVDGRAMRFCNNAAVAADGTVWFTDSSLHHGRDEWREEMVRDTRSGRLLRRDPDGSVTVVLDGLAFANGVALAPDGSWLCVAETAAARLRVLRLDGGPVTAGAVVDDLPGYPDNLSLGSDGLVWVALASPVDPVLSVVQRGPLAVRRLATRLPERLQPSPRRTVRVRAYAVSAGAADLRHDLDATEVAAQAGPGGGFHMVTGVREHEGRVWLGSLEEGAVAALDR